MIAVLTDHKNMVDSVAVSPDGKTMATAGHRAVMIWNVAIPAAPTRLATLTDHKDSVSLPQPRHLHHHVPTHRPTLLGTLKRPRSGRRGAGRHIISS
ncbi:hypothetical protein [Dactylosporangium salmoneum]|uniref:hypothetical protein n=1 Tax=Dactylosporangium salmoneum TaxID=53361 RepID=UPI003CD09866